MTCVRARLLLAQVRETLANWTCEFGLVNDDDPSLSIWMCREMLQQLRQMFERSPPSDALCIPGADAHKDPLTWWREKEYFRPISHIARILFSVPATSASSERAFSGTALNASKRRAALSPEKIERLAVIQQYLRICDLDEFTDHMRQAVKTAQESQSSGKRKRHEQDEVRACALALACYAHTSTLPSPRYSLATWYEHAHTHTHTQAVE